MAANKIKSYRPPFYGVDLKTDDINRDYPYSSGGQNAMLGPNSEISTRYGTQIRASGIGKWGSAVYKGSDLLGNYKEEVVCFGHHPANGTEKEWSRFCVFVLKEESFTITNNHATSTATVRCW